MPTTVVNKYHKIPYDVNIMRPSVWGNPYSHMEGTLAEYKVDTREEAVANYKSYLLGSEILINKLPELIGKILCCVCKPKSCHGDWLAYYALLVEYNRCVYCKGEPGPYCDYCNDTGTDVGRRAWSIEKEKKK